MNKTILVKIKKEEETGKNSVPMHPELSYQRSLGENIWEAKNTKTGESVRVAKVVKGDFIEYEIEAIQ